VIGVSIGCKLQTTMPICAELKSLQLDTQNAYYFGDIVVLPEGWGKGIADKLYQQHISFVASKGYTNILALIIEREVDDPRRPKDFRPSALWNRYDFVATNQTVQFAWKTIDKEGEPATKQTHTLRIFEKTIE